MRNGRRGKFGALILAGLAGLICVGIVMKATGLHHRLAGSRLRDLARAPLALLSLAAQPGAAPAAGPLPPPPTMLGVDVTGPRMISGERSFANLVIGGSWLSGVAGVSFAPMDMAQLDPDGVPVRLPAGQDLNIYLTPPYQSGPSPKIRCTFAGKGNLTAHGAAADVQPSAHGLTFRWIKPGDPPGLWIIAHGLDARDPLRDFDCRETTMPAAERFDPAFVTWLRGFKVLRFMDWQHVNENRPIRWATRHTQASIEGWTDDGVAVEDMVALASAVGADPWFNMAWNADDDYIARFAGYVHDHLPPDRKIYVETANEVWNDGFPAAKQARAEGVARGLSADPAQAGLLRYAQRTVEVMKIWERVFADSPQRLVRVAAVQHYNLNAETVLGAPGVAAHVDALATAPYFGLDVMAAGPTSDLDEIFRRLDGSVDRAIDVAVQQKAIAARHGKRYIAYEAGQHVVLYTDEPLQKRIQRDPRMYTAYKRYIDAWRQRIGDTMILFGSAGPINAGAWGLVEYTGQPESAAPKLRAVREALAK